jgi:hypothetical protein
VDGKPNDTGHGWLPAVRATAEARWFLWLGGAGWRRDLLESVLRTDVALLLMAACIGMPKVYTAMRTEQLSAKYKSTVFRVFVVSGCSPLLGYRAMVLYGFSRSRGHHILAAP